MPRRNQSNLERAVARAGGNLLGYTTGRDGNTYARVRTAGGRTMQIPMQGRGGGSGSAGG